MGTLGKAIYSVGFWIRETGQALDRLGSRLQGNYYFQEQLSRHRTLMNVFDKVPAVDKDAFVAPSASVIGDVQIGAGSSIWYGCVWGGNPARFQRKLTDEEIAFISQSAINYSNLTQVHSAENAKSFDEIEFEKVLRKEIY
ncbi:Gamma carbonic anhydrase 1, mitochondrial-like protein [Drosera capensis]